MKDALEIDGRRYVAVDAAARVLRRLNGKIIDASGSSAEFNHRSAQLGRAAVRIRVYDGWPDGADRTSLDISLPRLVAKLISECRGDCAEDDYRSLAEHVDALCGLASGLEKLSKRLRTASRQLEADGAAAAAREAALNAKNEAALAERHREAQRYALDLVLPVYGMPISRLSLPDWITAELDREGIRTISQVFDFDPLEAGSTGLPATHAGLVAYCAAFEFHRRMEIASRVHGWMPSPESGLVCIEGRVHFSPALVEAIQEQYIPGYLQEKVKRRNQS